MADWVLKGVYPKVFGCSHQPSLNKFFDPSPPSMRKGEKNRRERGEKKKRLMKIVATTSLLAVDRPNAAHSC